MNYIYLLIGFGLIVFVFILYKMKILNTIFNFILLSVSIILEIWTDLIFKIAGNLFPLYIGAFILLLVDSKSISKVIDPVSFILYSSTFLFSTMYLWYKTIDVKNKNGLIIFLVFLLTAIVISLMYAFSFTEVLDRNFDLSVWSYRIFGFTVVIYIIYECISHYKANKSNFGAASNSNYDSFKALFDKNKGNG